MVPVSTKPVGSCNLACGCGRSGFARPGPYGDVVEVVSEPFRPGLDLLLAPVELPLQDSEGHALLRWQGTKVEHLLLVVTVHMADQLVEAVDLPFGGAEIVVDGGLGVWSASEVRHAVITSSVSLSSRSRAEAA